MKNSFIAVLLFCCMAFGTPCVAGLPNDYYKNLGGQSTPSAILQQLESIVSPHTTLSYSSLGKYYEQTDLDSLGHIWDMYSLCTFTLSSGGGNSKVCSGWNKEHSIPQSWFSEQSPMKSDLFHVYPTDAKVNGYRSNMPYGETSSTAMLDGSPYALGHKGPSSFEGYTNIGNVYEPDDEYKGDFARTYFYMVACYLNRNFTCNSEGTKVFSYKNSTTALTPYAVSLFMKWHRQDPVSKKEINRNNAVYDIQHNRNPFIDYPYLAEYIWGTLQNQTLDMTALISSSDARFIPGLSNGFLGSTDPMLSSTADHVAFPAVLATESEQHLFTITGANLTEGISFTVSGNNADLFEVAPAYVTANNANGTHTVTVIFTPVSVGSFNALLTISSKGAESINLPLSGSCSTGCSVGWMVNNQPYLVGNPSTSVALRGVVTVLPTEPSSFSDQSPCFVGWTAFPIDGTTDETPADLFADAQEAPIVTGDVVYHAVFAQRSQVESGPTTYRFNATDQAGWTVNVGKNSTGAYWIFSKDKSLTSPELNLSDLKAIRANMRTYGGSNYRDLNVSANGQPVCTLRAGSNTMKDYTWVRSDTCSLSGVGALVFSSATSSKENGPGVSAIEVDVNGTSVAYSRYITTSSTISMINVPQLQEPEAVKFIEDGKLYILINNVIYDVFGQQVSDN